MLNSKNEIDDHVRKFPGFFTLFAKLFKKIDKINYSINDETFSSDWIAGMFMMFNYEDFKKLKGFDENFFLYYEDRDISKRMVELNKKLYVLNKVRIYHKFGGNSRSRNKEVYNKSWQIRFWHLYWSSFYYYRKHYGLLNSIRVHLSKFIRFKYLYIYYRLTNNKNLSDLNNCRANGILSQLTNKKAQPIPKILL